MTISTIIPAYNCSKYIEKAINSIKEQTIFTRKNIKNEIIVIDDGSDDDIDFVRKKLNVKLIRLEENKGFAFARNSGFTFAEGDIIALQDADDFSDPKRYEIQYDFLQKNNLVYLSCGMRMFKNGKILKVQKKYKNPEECYKVQILNKKMQNGLYEKPFFDAPSMFLREVIDIGTRYPNNLKVGADWIFELQVQYYFPKKMFIIPDILYNYIRHGDGLVDKYLYGKDAKNNYDLINKEIERWRRKILEKNNEF